MRRAASRAFDAYLALVVRELPIGFERAAVPNRCWACVTRFNAREGDSTA